MGRSQTSVLLAVPASLETHSSPPQVFLSYSFSGYREDWAQL